MPDHDVASHAAVIHIVAIYAVVSHDRSWGVGAAPAQHTAGAAAYPYALGTAATVGDFESTATAPANGGGDAGGAGSGASPNAADCSALPDEEKEARKPRPLSATSVTNVTNLRRKKK